MYIVFLATSVLSKDGEVMSFMELMGEALKFHKTGMCAMFEFVF